MKAHSINKGISPRVIIAGIRGGAGKTTVSLGVIAALAKRGLNVVPFKKGPDYIDAGWLSSAAGRDCYNLDPFMISDRNIISSFRTHFDAADLAVIEGNRGLFDGMDAEGTFSTAELAKILNAPVILVMDCTKVTRTAAAMLFGMVRFDPKVKIAGVVLNQIAGRRHETVIRESVAKYCRVPVVGAIPKLKGEQLSERHMGLTPFQEHPGVKDAISICRETAEKYLDLDAILEVARSAPALRSFGVDSFSTHHPLPITHHGLRIGIIRDSAFQFYYPENFEALQKRGAEIIEISALTEKKIPDIDALYIGGGFPETHAIALAKNRSFRNSLKNAVESGLPVYAECGGLMYLGTALMLGKKRYEMTGVFPFVFGLEKRPQAHGYTIIKVSAVNPYYRRGITLKGHEFHYSKVVNQEECRETDFSFSSERGGGIIDGRDGACYKNVLATYTHLHALGSPEWADGMLKQAIKYRRSRR